MKLEIISPTNDGSTMTRPSLLIKHVDTTSLIERREEKTVHDFDTLILWSLRFWDELGLFSNLVTGWSSPFLFFFFLDSYKCLFAYELQAKE